MVMTFGLTNAPALFQSLMNRVLAPFLDKSVIVYLDDILIFSSDLKTHKQHLWQVLQALQQEKLVAKKKKCTFAVQQVEYLGHII
jgi:hypothetical protein